MSYTIEVLVGAISKLTSLLENSVNKCDINNLEQRLDMKLSQVKDIVTASAAKNVEAFAELGALVALLNTQLADAIAANADPEVTDEAFLATLADLELTSKKLADIVPNPEPPAPPAEPAPAPTA